MKSGTEKHKVEVSPFERICWAAIAENSNELSKALKLACIDVWNEAEYGTPVTALAYAGYVTSVKFLLDRGASPANAACGYARAGMMEELYDLISYVKEKNPDKLTAVLKKAAYGIALSQDEEKIKAFLEKIKKDHPTQIHELQSDLFIGYAQTNNLTAIESNPLYRTEEEKSFLAITKGMALSGNVYGIEKFIADNTRPYPLDCLFVNSKLFHQEIFTCLARAGHSAKAGSLSFYKRREHTQFLIAGQAQNGIDDGTIHTAAAFVDNETKAEAFAFGGHKAKAYQYGKPEKINGNWDFSNLYNAFFNIGVGFIKGNHFDAAYDFFKNNMSHRYIDIILDKISEAFYGNKNSKGAIAFLEKMHDDPNVDRNHVALFAAKLKKHFPESVEDITFCLQEKERALFLNTNLTGTLPSPLVNLVIQYSKEISPTDASTLHNNTAGFFTDHTGTESKSESKISPPGITQGELQRILVTYEPANFLGIPSKEIAALSLLAHDPRFDNVLIHHSVIADILSRYPRRHARFTNLPGTVSNTTDTDRIIMEIRRLYETKSAWEEYIGRQNRKR